jgi:hypothetical protein
VVVSLTIRVQTPSGFSDGEAVDFGAPFVDLGELERFGVHLNDGEGVAIGDEAHDIVGVFVFGMQPFLRIVVTQRIVEVLASRAGDEIENAVRFGDLLAVCAAVLPLFWHERSVIAAARFRERV